MSASPLTKSYVAKPRDIQRAWYVIDAAGRPLGRLATQVAMILQGKHKPIYTPYIDTGDFVIVINAQKVKLTGRKLDRKIYYRHTGYPHGLREMTYRTFLATRPERVIEKAVKGMLPNGTMGRAMYRKLKVYKGIEHPHAAQQPIPWAGRD